MKLKLSFDHRSSHKLPFVLGKLDVSIRFRRARPNGTDHQTKSDSPCSPGWPLSTCVVSTGSYGTTRTPCGLPNLQVLFRILQWTTVTSTTVRPLFGDDLYEPWSEAYPQPLLKTHNSVDDLSTPSWIRSLRKRELISALTYALNLT